MDVIKKEEMETNNNLDLHKIKIELDALPYNFDMNTPQEYQRITFAYNSATDSFVKTFYDIIKYYDDEGLPNFITHHLWRPITAYDDWNAACTTTFRQLNIPLTYTNTWIAHVRPVTVPEIKRCIRLTLTDAKYLSELISSHDRAAVNDMNICLRAVRTSLSRLQLDLDRLGTPDVPHARGPFAMAENPLKRMIQMHYIEYHNAFFT